MFNEVARNGFYGKAYRYKEKTIGVCNTLREGVFMIGHATPGGHKRIKALPLFEAIDDAQKALDEFAAAKGLTEVQA